MVIFPITLSVVSLTFCRESAPNLSTSSSVIAMMDVGIFRCATAEPSGDLTGVVDAGTGRLELSVDVKTGAAAFNLDNGEGFVSTILCICIDMKIVLH
ncbi:hypothetical protein RsoM2USA_21 [Ralstonia phage RsoM2USA]|nr:hypothetical protein RsoM2USA_21 [Ralstonia phage RsoM2USA]